MSFLIHLTLAWMALLSQTPPVRLSDVSDITGHDHHCTGHGVASLWNRLTWARYPAEIFPLYLSPMIEKGCIKEAQAKARVHLSPHHVRSYSGLMTVNEQYRSNMFFWFFPAQTKPRKAPVLLWLNGGPGRLSTFGALLENGPYEITANGTLKLREVSWVQHFSMLYVDNPVGVGYSSTKSDAGLSTSRQDIAKNLYSVLVQFFKLFPEYSKNEFYVGGQSYAGKYVPSLGCYIHERNNDRLNPPHLHINFKGIYLGAGYCDPENMMPAFADYMYNMGFVSSTYRQILLSRFSQIFREFHSGVVRNTTFYLTEFFSRPSDHAGEISVDHALGSDATNDHLLSALYSFMRSWSTRINLHVGVSEELPPLYFAMHAANALRNEFLTNTSKENAFLMNNYKVLHYSGNLDVVVSVPMTEEFLQHVQWKGQKEYRDSLRNPWFVLDDDYVFTHPACKRPKDAATTQRCQRRLAGWYTRIGNFTRVIIRNSGHMAPYDQPQSTLEMMKNFIFDQSFISEPYDSLHV